MRKLAGIVIVVGWALTSPRFSGAQIQNDAVRGSWKVDSYVLKSGETHEVDGLMQFSENEWTIVYFVKASDGEPRRGVGAGGPYTFDGHALVFTRDYVVIGGSEVGELDAIPLRFTVPGDEASFVENCRVELDGDHLLIEFPSGNTMGFRRSSPP